MQIAHISSKGFFVISTKEKKLLPVIRLTLQLYKQEFHYNHEEKKVTESFGLQEVKFDLSEESALTLIDHLKMEIENLKSMQASSTAIGVTVVEKKIPAKKKK